MGFQIELPHINTCLNAIPVGPTDTLHVPVRLIMWWSVSHGRLVVLGVPNGLTMLKYGNGQSEALRFELRKLLTTG